jgi:hypothetical protein
MMGHVIIEAIDFLQPWMLGLCVPVAAAAIELLVLHLLYGK